MTAFFVQLHRDYSVVGQRKRERVRISSGEDSAVLKFKKRSQNKCFLLLPCLLLESGTGVCFLSMKVMKSHVFLFRCLKQIASCHDSEADFNLRHKLDQCLQDGSATLFQ